MEITSDLLVFDAYHNTLFLDSAQSVVSTFVESKIALNIHDLLKLTQIPKTDLISILFMLLKYNCIKKVKKVSFNSKPITFYRISDAFEVFLYGQ